MGFLGQEMDLTLLKPLPKHIRVQRIPTVSEKITYKE